ncbi:MAG TPA: endonuclease/exonuclease/phosphatase family protein [Longimicrobiaceae bacterium]
MPFRLLTWNINGTSQQNNGPDQLAEVIQHHRIDLVLLQEVAVNNCTLDAALTARLGAGNYTLQYEVSNPTQQQRTWTDPATGNSHTAQPAPQERYAIIRRQRGNGTYRVTINSIQALDYVNDVNVTTWIGERHPNLRSAHPGNPRKMQRLSRPPLVDSNRYVQLGFRRPVLVDATYHGHAYSIFTWHAPQGGGNGGANFSGQDARLGYALWIRAGGGSHHPGARVILAGDLNARVAGVTGLNQNWPYAVHPTPGNIHNDGVSHIYAKGTHIQELNRRRVRNLANHSDHVALAATVP